jgi:aspartate aminotransferase-like enzyme
MACILRLKKRCPFILCPSCGAEVFILEKPWGSVFEPGEVIAAMETFKPNVVAMVHSETSTGRVQPLADLVFRRHLTYMRKK